MRAHGPTRRASGVQLAWLHGGRRLHLQHGPIDLIALAEGPPQAVRQAYRQAVDAFDSVLQDLVDELPLLRRDVGAAARPVGDIARAMHEAARRVRHAGFASPMIAVAGAVADHILLCMLRDNPGLTRASVNNGGDIAMYLAGSSAFEIGLVADPQRGEQIGTIRIGVADAPRGVATSGWRGRSHSLGIADAVTVLADCAASADAAATLIANVVDVPGCGAIARQPARELDPDTELGARPVTVAVGALSGADVARALAAGQRLAQRLCDDGAIDGACISLQGAHQTTGFHLAATLASPFKQQQRLQYA